MQPDHLYRIFTAINNTFTGTCYMLNIIGGVRA